MQDIAPASTDNLVSMTQSSNASHDNFKSLLKNSLMQLFDSTSCYLNLECVNEVELFKRNNIRINFSSRSSVSILFNTIHEIFPNMRALNLAKNDIVNFKNFHGCKHWFSQLKNLSIENNRIARLADIQPLSELSNLEELILKNNTCACEGPFPLNLLFTYFRETCKRFPQLNFLDRVQLSNYLWFLKPSSQFSDPNLLTPRPSFFDKPETQQLVSSILQK